MKFCRPTPKAAAIQPTMVASMSESLTSLKDHWPFLILLFVFFHFIIRRSIRNARLDELLRRQNLR